ncbi:MAG: SbcC/MukB-like Walker B domain-containing protein, partial [Candidatus Riflebacteria bacterium]|nr:SbcC/MukB-like Walker B domain-containing protein [Candidatus Riflebacteria bacterium]
AVQEKTSLVAESEKRNNTARTAIFAKLQSFGIDEIPDNDLAALMSVLQARLQAWQETQARKTEVENRLQKLAADLKGLEGVAATLDAALTARKASLAGLLATMQQLQNERREMFGERNPDEEEQVLDKQIAQAEKAVQKAQAALDQARTRLNEAKTNAKTIEERISGRTAGLAGLEKAFVLNLGRKGFADEATFVACKMTEVQCQALTQQAQELDKKVADTLTRLRDSEAKLDQERQLNLTAVSMAEMQAKVDEQAAKIKGLVEATGGLKQKLDDNRRAIELVSNRRGEIDRQSRECSKWNLLNSLIGSKDGQKYSKFAQGLTFGIIVSLANQQLEKMTGRYLLTRDPVELLELKIVDKYQAGEVRSTKNLSGGESFIVSLALALGLSKLASKKVRVDSLFLDEGFGTLDDDALQIALDTLAGLQQDGKLIGVISHVAMLKERIGTQITVSGSNTGRSTISGPGISRV